jgi:hypothetical protein
MTEIRRINLSFNLRDDKAREAYEIIMSKSSAKTVFVTDAVLAYIENNTPINKQTIKDAVREAIQEAGFIAVNTVNSKEATNGIPDDVFDIISQI